MHRHPLLLATCLALASTLAYAHENHNKATDMGKLWAGILAKPPAAAGVAFDRHGTLWLAEVKDKHLWVSHSTDLGRHFSTPVKVNPKPEHIAADGENRPKIRVADNGSVTISYTQSLAQPMTGDVRFSRSLDGGKRFSAPITVNDNRDLISHRFDSLSIGPNGDITVAWLDKRDLNAAKAQGNDYRGAAVYSARSRNGGASFEPNRKLADHACECCRIAVANDADGTPVIAWRHVFDGNLRDHAIARLDNQATAQRVSDDNWQLDACPHHGPALSIEPDGRRHLVWFTNSPTRQGLYYAQSAGPDQPFSTPLGFGDNNAQAGHADVLASPSQLSVVWKEFDGQQSLIRAMVSRDHGQQWRNLPALASSAGSSDHPQLLYNPANGNTYLAWYTRQQGLRLIELRAP